MSKMPYNIEDLENKIKDLEDEANTSLIKIYNFLGITVRFEKRLNIVEIDTRGVLTQDTKAQQSIDFNIDVNLTSKTDTKFIVIPMGEENLRYSIVSNYAKRSATLEKFCQ